jgi:hypothetical protein
MQPPSFDIRFINNPSPVENLNMPIRCTLSFTNNVVIIVPPWNDSGYTVLVKPSPVQVQEIQGTWYRNHVEGENCCGSAEFIKLYAYELITHDIVVHWDMDVAVLAPMDDLFDAMLFSKDSPEGQAARLRLERQHPEEDLPDQIDAYFTRDITSAQPWEKHQGVQGGFLVARPSLEVLKMYIDLMNWETLLEVAARDLDGMEWVMAAFKAPWRIKALLRSFTITLSPIQRLNWPSVDGIKLLPMSFGGVHREWNITCSVERYPKDGNFEANTKCEDCRVTPIELVKTVHYTACKKPWECALPHPRVPHDKNHVYRLSHLTNITTCGLLFRKWFELRHDLELQFKQYDVEPVTHEGTFYSRVFPGLIVPGRTDTFP